MAAPMIYSFLFVVQVALGMLLCHRAMPRLLSTRGHWHAMCVSLLAAYLFLQGSAFLRMSYTGAAMDWLLVASNVVIMAYSFCRLRHALLLSDCTWAKGPSAA